MKQKPKRGHNWRSWPSSQQANLKIPPELHRRLKIRAAQDGVKLQDLVARVLACALDGGPVATT